MKSSSPLDPSDNSKHAQIASFIDKDFQNRPPTIWQRIPLALRIGWIGGITAGLVGSFIVLARVPVVHVSALIFYPTYGPIFGLIGGVLGGTLGSFILIPWEFRRPGGERGTRSAMWHLIIIAVAFGYWEYTSYLLRPLSSSKATSQELIALSHNLLTRHTWNTEGKYRVAMLPDAPVRLLEQFSQESDITLHRVLAKNPNVPADIARRLATEDDVDIRMNLAQNLAVPTEVLNQLAVADPLLKKDVINLTLRRQAQAAIGLSDSLFSGTGQQNVQAMNDWIDQHGQKNGKPDTAALNQALVLAVQHQNVAAIEALMKSGADINAKIDDFPILFEAVLNEPQVAQWLIQHGAKVDVVSSKKGADNREESGETLLQLIVSMNYRDKMLHDYFPKGIPKKLLNATDSTGYTVLHYSIEHAPLSTLQMLVEQGANVNAGAKDGTTPLVIAAKWCQVDQIRYLVSKGANPNPKDSNGKPLLGFLSSAPSPDMLYYLKDNCYPELKDFLDNLKYTEK